MAARGGFVLEAVNRCRSKSLLGEKMEVAACRWKLQVEVANLFLARHI